MHLELNVRANWSIVADWVSGISTDIQQSNRSQGM